MIGLKVKSIILTPNNNLNSKIEKKKTYGYLRLVIRNIF